jgi:hypothetical protein
VNRTRDLKDASESFYNHSKGRLFHIANLNCSPLLLLTSKSSQVCNTTDIFVVTRATYLILNVSELSFDPFACVVLWQGSQLPGSHWADPLHGIIRHQPGHQLDALNCEVT